MAYKIYILYSDSYRRTYVGFSKNSESRLENHNAGKVKSTKRFRSWKIVFEEEIDDYSSARKREIFYKSGIGRRRIKAIFDELGIN